MQVHVRAASLCAAALLAVVLPTCASAQFPAATMDNTVWPSGTNLPAPTADPGAQGPCDPGAGTKTFTFASTGPGRLAHADGIYSEQGSFSLARVDGVLRVTDYDSTFSGSSPKGSVVGERHLRPSEVSSTTVDCRGGIE